MTLNQQTTPPPLLAIKGLQTQFASGRSAIKAVQSVDLTIAAGEIVGLVGESGSGKSVLALSILRLIQSPGRITQGHVFFAGRDVLTMSSRELSAWRGRDIGMIFQQPQGSLNPVRRIGWQVAEPLRQQERISRKAAWDKAVTLLRSVGIPAPEEKALAYPHQLSGGQAQRVMIAIALALKPRLLIADEPTTALDVTIQAQILELLRDSCRDFGTSLLLVTHDLGVVARLADRVAVMYAGRIVEEGPVSVMLTKPEHPYARGLLDAAPRLGQFAGQRLKDIPGSIPDLGRPMRGCAFAPRCERRAKLKLEACLTDLPPSTSIGERHSARCWVLPQTDEALPTATVMEDRA